VEAELRKAQAELALLRRREGALQAQITQLTRALEASEQQLAEVPSLRDELEAARDAAYWLDVTKASLSWRLTRPLRWVTRGRRRAEGRQPPPP
jgi:multidrug resistance efflux pump